MLPCQSFGVPVNLYLEGCLVSSLSVCHPFCPQLKDLPASYLDVCLAVWQTSYLLVTLTAVSLYGKPLTCLDVCLPVWQTSYLPVILRAVSRYGKPLTCQLPLRLSPCTANLLPASYLDVCLADWQTSYLPVTLTSVWQTSYLPVTLTAVSLYGKPLTCQLP